MPTSNEDATDVLRRRLRYRSHHRGTKELDVLLGRFADCHLDALTRDQLVTYEALLAVEDPVMLGWLMGTAEPPRDARSDVLDLLLRFVGGRGPA
ncbi:MAG: succinate dehydrogenase assembly factor 2 [Alphaproteobacteria bacterium]